MRCQAPVPGPSRRVSAASGELQETLTDVTRATWGTPPEPSLLTGDEAIAGIDGRLRDFWAWGMSDLRANAVRSLLAEFLVARAVGAATAPRIEWDAYDVR